MSTFRPLATVPDGYFQNLRATMEDAALDQIIFRYSPLTDDVSALQLSQLKLKGEFFDYEYGWFGLDPMGGALIVDAYRPKCQRLAAAALQLHGLILQANPETAASQRIRVDVRIHDVEKPDRRGLRYHTDGDPNTKWLGYFACDAFGTLYPSRLLRRPRTMPTHTINEFYPDTKHAPPFTTSDEPIARTFIRLMYFFT